KRTEARKKGQVARSVDLNGAVVLMAGLFALSGFGPGMLRRLEEATVAVLDLVKTPQVVDRGGLGSLLGSVGEHVALAVLPIVAVCALAGVLVNVLQVGFRPSMTALK